MKDYRKGLFQVMFVMILLVTGKIWADTVYVWSDDANGTIRSIGTNGTVSVYATSNTLSGWNGPTGLVLDNIGDLYAGCPGESEIIRFTPAGTIAEISYSDDSVSGLAFDSSGKLFATVPNYDALTETAYASDFGYYYGLYQSYTTSNLGCPVCLAFDGSSNIYVSNFGINSVERFMHDFTDLGTVASGTNTSTGINNPWGIAFDASGNLYVANSGSDTIVKIRTNGVRFVQANSTAGLNSPRGLAFDSAGNLFVANYYGGNILKLSTNGSWSVFASGLTFPTSLAIYPGLKVWSAAPLKLNNPTVLSGGTLQFSFIGSAGLDFDALATTNLSQTWSATNPVTEISPGLYEFSDSQATNYPQRFYRVRSH